MIAETGFFHGYLPCFRLKFKSEPAHILSFRRNLLQVVSAAPPHREPASQVAFKRYDRLCPASMFDVDLPHKLLKHHPQLDPVRRNVVYAAQPRPSPRFTRLDLHEIERQENHARNPGRKMAESHSIYLMKRISKYKKRRRKIAYYRAATLNFKKQSKYMHPREVPIMGIIGT